MEKKINVIFYVRPKLKAFAPPPNGESGGMGDMYEGGEEGGPPGDDQLFQQQDDGFGQMGLPLKNGPVGK